MYYLMKAQKALEKRRESHDMLTFHGVPPVLNKGKDPVLYG